MSRRYRGRRGVSARAVLPLLLLSGLLAGFPCRPSHVADLSRAAPRPAAVSSRTSIEVRSFDEGSVLDLATDGGEAHATIPPGSDVRSLSLIVGTDGGGGTGVRLVVGDRPVWNFSSAYGPLGRADRDGSGQGLWSVEGKTVRTVVLPADATVVASSVRVRLESGSNASVAVDAGADGVPEAAAGIGGDGSGAWRTLSLDSAGLNLALRRAANRTWEDADGNRMSTVALVFSSDAPVTFAALNLTYAWTRGLGDAAEAARAYLSARPGAGTLPFRLESDDPGRLILGGLRLLAVRPNAPPVLSAENLTAVLGDEVVFRVSAWDPDGDPVALEVRQLSGPKVVWEAGRFVAEEAGTYTFAVYASDGDLSSEAHFTVEVVARAPAIWIGTPLGNSTVAAQCAVEVVVALPWPEYDAADGAAFLELDGREVLAMTLLSFVQGEGYAVRRYRAEATFGPGTHLVEARWTSGGLELGAWTLFTVPFPGEEPPMPDADGDGVPDAVDAFPADKAASVDSDGDGYPDLWNPGLAGAGSATGLALDPFPNDPTQWSDADGDGYGDNPLGIRPDHDPLDPGRWEAPPETPERARKGTGEVRAGVVLALATVVLLVVVREVNRRS